MQLKISYQYRDAGNNKNYDEIVLSNPSGVTTDELFSLFQTSFAEDQLDTESTHIKPEIIGLAPLYFHDYAPDLDHPLHEVMDISSTEERATLDITIDDIIHRMKMLAQR